MLEIVSLSTHIYKKQTFPVGPVGHNNALLDPPLKVAISQLDSQRSHPQLQPCKAKQRTPKSLCYAANPTKSTSMTYSPKRNIQ